MKYFTFIGNHDTIDAKRRGFGSALTIFFHYKDSINGVYIFTTPDKGHISYKKIADKTKNIINQENKEILVSIIEMDIDNPVDFDLVYKVMLDETHKAINKDALQEDKKIINITSGTPTMSTCWVLLQKSGLIPNAQLVQSFEPQFQRLYGKTCQVVDLTIDDFPAFGRPTTANRGKSSSTVSTCSGKALTTASSKSPVPLPLTLAMLKYSPNPNE